MRRGPRSGSLLWSHSPRAGLCPERGQAQQTTGLQMLRGRRDRQSGMRVSLAQSMTGLVSAAVSTSLIGCNKLQHQGFDGRAREERRLPGRDRPFFRDLYLILLGSKQGPRAAPFLPVLEKDWVLRRL